MIKESQLFYRADSFYLKEKKEKKISSEFWRAFQGSSEITRIKMLTILFLIGDIDWGINISQKICPSELTEGETLFLINTLRAKGDFYLFTIKEFLSSKNPFIIRCAFVTLGKIATEKSFLMALDFIVSIRGRIIKREIVESVLGYSFKINPRLEDIFIKIKVRDDVRRYFSGMKIPKYLKNQISFFPSHDYLKNYMESLNVDYDIVKYGLNHVFGVKKLYD